jgi:hypothetical protein
MPSGIEAAAFERLLWTEPTIDVHLTRTNDRIATQLVFTIPFPKEFARTYRSLFKVICEPTPSDWEHAIADSYRKSIYNKRFLSQRVSNLLRRAFKGGVELWLTANRDFLGTYLGTEDQKKSLQDLTNIELSTFRKEAISKTGSQPEADLALSIVHRHQALLKKLRYIKKNFGKVPIDRLPRKIRKMLPYSIFLRALRNMVAERNKFGPKLFFTTSGVTPRLMADEMLKLELKDRGCDLMRVSLKKYLKLGHHLQEMLADVPQPFAKKVELVPTPRLPRS